ncbi:MAG: metal ABC transporter permease [Phycisphaerales bacterium]
MTLASFRFDLGLDLFPMLAVTLAALCCGVLGNFLVLRRLSLMGDAISHSVLPGLVIAFLITTSRSPAVMMLGAAAAGVATVVLVELVKKLGRVEPGAAMGVVFSVLFALGVLLIERAAVRHVDLDADCVLHGQLETLAWYGAPESVGELLRWSTLSAVPMPIITLLLMCAIAGVFVVLFFKELRLAAFDPELATSQGFNATLMHYMLMVLVAGATVASFEAVGSILVIAMLICPAATARLLTDRLGSQIGVSLGIALLAGIGGYIAAAAVPDLFGKEAVNAAGSVTVFSGLLLVAAIVASPRYGVISRLVRRRRLAVRVAIDDLLASMHRAGESGTHELDVSRLRQELVGRPSRAAIARAVRRGLLDRTRTTVRLTDKGRVRAADVVRRHRLWEHYLVDRAGLAEDHVHAVAEQLEHFHAQPPTGPLHDPHGRIIPTVDDPDRG